MIEMLETRRLLSALPVTEAPVEVEPQTVRVVTLEEFLAMESWNDDEIVVEWYSEPSEEDEDWDWGDDGWGDDDWGGDWESELEEADMWADDVCDGPTDEPLDDEDFALIEEWDLVDEPIVIISDDAGAPSSFNDDESIGADVLGTADDELLG